MNTHLSYALPSVEERVAFLLDPNNGRVEDNGDGCLVWTGQHPGRLRVDGRRVMLTTLAWSLEHPGEPVPKMITTSCGTHHCVDPGHLIEAASAFGGLNAQRHQQKLARLEREDAEKRRGGASPATCRHVEGAAVVPVTITAAGPPHVTPFGKVDDVSVAADLARRRAEAIGRISATNEEADE